LGAAARSRTAPVVDTDEPEVLVVADQGAWPSDVSPDGRDLIYGMFADETGHDIWSAPLTSGGKPRPILRSPTREYQAQVSPDGAWLAYTTNASGQPEILLRRFDDNSNAIPVTTSGGVMPRWAHDARQLFYLSLDAKMTAVPIAMSGRRIDLGPQKTLFTAPVRRSTLEATGLSAFYDVAPDGRFLVSVDPPERPPITVVLNWKPPPAR
jgi:WD40-like Beta Propeller Repeat